MFMSLVIVVFTTYPVAVSFFLTVVWLKMTFYIGNWIRKGSVFYISHSLNSFIWLCPTFKKVLT